MGVFVYQCQDCETIFSVVECDSYFPQRPSCYKCHGPGKLIGRETKSREWMRSEARKKQILKENQGKETPLDDSYTLGDMVL